MIKVNMFDHENKIIAELRLSSLDGEIKYSGIAAEEIKTILSDEFPILMGEESRWLSAKRTPLDFMVNLFKIISGSYLRAGMPEFIDDDIELIKSDNDAIVLLNTYSSDVYDFIDKTIEKAGLAIPGDHPEGAKKVGKQIEASLYTSLKRKIEDYLKDISSKVPQHEVINTVSDIIQSWQKSMGDQLDEAFNNLFVRGVVAGIISSGVKPAFGLADKLALEFLKRDPTRIGRRIVLFSQDLVEKFRPIIANSYTAEGVFNVDFLTNELRKVVPAEKWKLERIVRTETAVVSNIGRLLGWSKDPDRFYYAYSWNNTTDHRTKPISLLRGDSSPYSWYEICFLWENQEQLINGKWQVDWPNQRCSVSRGPIDYEWKKDRFSGQEGIFKATTPLGFNYRDEGAE